MEQTNLLKAQDVAQRLNVSRFRVYEMVRERILPPEIVVPLGLRQMRFKPAELEQFIRNSAAREKPTQEAKPIPCSESKPDRATRKRSAQRAAA